MNKTDTPLAVAPTAELGLVPERWYVVDSDGLATLCKDEDDARESASGYWSLYPRRGPYRAVLLGDVAAERERCARLCESVADGHRALWHDDADPFDQGAADALDAMAMRIRGPNAELRGCPLRPEQE